MNTSEVKKLTSDDLTGIMMELDSVQTLLGEIHNEFFDVHNPDTERDEIAWSFPRARVKSNAVQFLLMDAIEALRKLGGSEGYAEDKTRAAKQKEVKP